MALYLYIKEDTSNKRKMIIYFSYISLTIGLLLLFWSFYPIISFEIYSRLFIDKSFLSPLPKSEKVSSIETMTSVLGTFNIFSNNLRDFTQVNLWFPNITADSSFPKLSLREYTLSIPKLNIKDARVIVGGEDLKNSLVHYLPQSAPGEYGNVVIFGHSTLPQLYDPKDYKTIFTYLPSLERGDKILIKAGGGEYEYEVYDMIVVDPDQVSVLEQRNDAAYLTLITCVPPGTYWKRLVVRAKLNYLH